MRCGTPHGQKQTAGMVARCSVIYSDVRSAACGVRRCRMYGENNVFLPSGYRAAVSRFFHVERPPRGRLVSAARCRAVSRAKLETAELSAVFCCKNKISRGFQTTDRGLKKSLGVITRPLRLTDRIAVVANFAAGGFRSLKFFEFWGALRRFYGQDRECVTPA